MVAVSNNLLWKLLTFLRCYFYVLDSNGSKVMPLLVMFFYSAAMIGLREFSVGGGIMLLWRVLARESATARISTDS